MTRRRRFIRLLLAGTLLVPALSGFNGDPAGDQGGVATTIPGNVAFAGMRSSIYGILPFPAPSGWLAASAAIRGNFLPSTVPCLLWVVGTKENRRACRLEFPSPGSAFAHILFSDTDRHQRYLDFFDQTGIKVFLQVEPMDADVATLIDMVLGRYGHHACVIGFGIDIEWYRESDKPGWGTKVSDAAAMAWEARVKSHKPGMRLFLKHWDRNWMPKTYRGDIVFVDDSQMLDNLDEAVEEFSSYWADHFKPNPVFFQIGYPRDRRWWKKLANPVRDIGVAVARRVGQPCGIFWVDFTLRELFPHI